MHGFPPCKSLVHLHSATFLCRSSRTAAASPHGQSGNRRSERTKRLLMYLANDTQPRTRS
ncbi:hypothetical protein ACPOL_4368 [Acidisarcina polymorpha]|uniref:Uncharacterized protein n=1 Tax=Acidisarcina polymorpha TaxID=2211140 RepID=A0A2Z5G3E0_9BACT|nr:hypothetical protein ACPOL_4368 [Acidisarcina polymorpha]